MVLALGLIAIAALVAAPAHAQEQRFLTYRATIRSFIPGRCVADANTFYDAWNYDGHGETKDDIESLANRASKCPYWSDILSGEIDGHPDFQVEGVAIDGFVLRTGIVQSTLAEAPSGLPKVQYCNPTGRCGCSSATKCATSNVTFFNDWYNDNPRYGKRIGSILNVYNSSACTIDPEFGEVCEYQFDSEFDDEVLGRQPPGNRDDFFGPLNALSPNGLTDLDIPDYRDARAWLRTGYDTGTVNKFWFTSEIHTAFLFRGGEELKFSGDDDVWIFINGQRIIDLGGVHPAEEGEITLDDTTATSLGLVPGNIYSFDLFHAERRTTDSNFKLTTQLGEACNVLQSGTQVLNFDGSGTGAAALVDSRFFLSRNARFDGTEEALVIADSSNLAAWSAVFGKTQFNVGSGFVARFTASFGTTGKPEGFAFVMHQRPDGLVNLPATTGGNLGFRYLSNSLALVFDLCADRADVGGACARQDIRLHYPSDPSAFNDASVATRRVYDDLFYLRPGREFEVEIVYLETPDWLEVYVDDSLYLRIIDFNISGVLGGGRNAFMGFTAATRGSEAADVLVHKWSVDTVELDTAKTLLVPRANASEPEVLVADGESAKGFAVQARDFCEELIQYGGQPELLTGLWVERPDPETGRYSNETATRPQLLNATVRDDDDGQYIAELVSSEPTGLFDLFVCFAPVCEFDITYTPAPAPTPAPVSRRALRNLQGAPPPVELADVALAPSSSAEAFFGSFPGALRVIPQTPVPTSSPTVTAPTQGPDTGSAVLGSAIGGGAALFALIMVGGVLFILRRRWQRDRAFIEEGALYNMEREVTYDKNDEYSVVGRMVLNTTAAIQRERAQKAGADGAKDADALAAENAELQEQIRLNKQKAQQQQQQAAAASIFSRGGKKGGKKKKEFQGDMANPQL